MISESLIKTQSKTKDGQHWLASLPELINQVRTLWDLQSLTPVDTDGSCSWIANARIDNDQEVIVKIGLPHMESRDEAMGLSLWQHTSSANTVELYAYDKLTNAMLLERCIPGTSLKTIPEDKQDEVICASLRTLWKLESNTALHRGVRDLGEMIAHWCAIARAQHADGPYANQVEAGCILFQELLESTRNKRLLATDLHAGNILSAERLPWLVIDPKPFVGDPAYDLTQHILNCQARLTTDPLALVARVAVLSGCNVSRIARWLAARLLTDSDVNEEKIRVAMELRTLAVDF